jgi:hypothetical protein
MRKKSKRSQAADLLSTYLKFKAVQKASVPARKAAKGWLSFKAVKALPVIGAVGAGAAIAAKRRRSAGEPSPV